MTAGREDGTAGALGQLRTSHADREAAIGVLKAAFVQGRLTKDMFDVRVGQAFASRTYADLDVLTRQSPYLPCSVPSRSAMVPSFRTHARQLEQVAG